METEEIYMNQGIKMQAAAFKDKKKGPPACKEGADDPAYENITLTFRNRDQPKGSHSPPKNKVPARARPPSDPAQLPHWLHRAMMSLHVLLALSCIALLALVLVKSEWGFGLAFWWQEQGAGVAERGSPGAGQIQCCCQPQNRDDLKLFLPPPPRRHPEQIPSCPRSCWS
uniref:Uncharacterized protein n=1 Tax=Catagonus wagneri TaxID=51154 RepID=A0A8C3WT49_9CETA